MQWSVSPDFFMFLVLCLLNKSWKVIFLLHMWMLAEVKQTFELGTWSVNYFYLCVIPKSFSFLKYEAGKYFLFHFYLFFFPECSRMWITLRDGRCVFEWSTVVSFFVLFFLLFFSCESCYVFGNHDRWFSDRFDDKLSNAFFVHNILRICLYH